MEITVVTLVEEQISSWKGNLPKLPIIIKYSAIGTRKYSGSLGTSLDPLWYGLSLHLSGDKFLRKLGMQGVGVIRVRMDMGDKEVTKQELVAKVVMEVLGRMLGDMVVMSWRYLRS
ncbi:hypothetical protein Tco_0964128 [Tanacetum coccineum]